MYYGSNKNSPIHKRSSMIKPSLRSSRNNFSSTMSVQNDMGRNSFVVT